MQDRGSVGKGWPQGESVGSRAAGGLVASR
jgi:hypothetical protein